jgi:hypothetical protein
VNYYNAPPESGKTLTATYRYQSVGIIGALATGAEHWMSVSMDGVTQGVRQRVLTVPFAISANSAAIAERAKQPTENVFLSKSEVSDVKLEPTNQTTNPQLYLCGSKCYVPGDLLNPILRSEISFYSTDWYGGFGAAFSPYDLKFEFVMGDKVFHVESLTKGDKGQFSHVFEAPLKPNLIGSGFKDFYIRVTLSNGKNFSNANYNISVSKFISSIILVNKP